MAAALSGCSVVVLIILLGGPPVTSSNLDKKIVDEGQWTIEVLEEKITDMKSDNSLLKMARGLCDSSLEMFGTIKFHMEDKGILPLLEAGEKFVHHLKHWLDDRIKSNETKIKSTKERIKEIKQEVKSLMQA